MPVVRRRTAPAPCARRVGQRAHRGADVVDRPRRHRVHRRARRRRARRRPRRGSPRRSRRRGRARARRSPRRRDSWCRRRVRIPAARRSACTRPARHRARSASRSRTARARRRVASDTARHMRSSSCAFFASNSSAVITPGRAGRRAARAARGSSGVAARPPAPDRWRSARPRRASRPACACHLHLPVDLLLHPVGVAHVVERRLAVAGPPTRSRGRRHRSPAPRSAGGS